MFVESSLSSISRAKVLTFHFSLGSLQFMKQGSEMESHNELETFKICFGIFECLCVIYSWLPMCMLCCVFVFFW